jgi:phosphohistidine phosphatase
VSGATEVEEVTEAMDKLKLGISHVISSPLKRAKETAIIAARGLKKEDLLELWDELKPEGDVKELYLRLSKLRQDSVVLLVGHEPYLSGMMGDLISGTRQVRITLKKAGVAKVEVTSLVPRPLGELRWLLTPRQMKKIA